MCGGVRFAYKPTYEEALAVVYSEEKLVQFRETGVIEAVFWQAQPILPVQFETAIQIIQWGNRDKQVRLPLTGWVRQESLDAGKWDYLQPQAITIPVQAGVERKIWFPITTGIEGILINHRDRSIVYMLTRPPTDRFFKLTNHDRMPAVIDQEL